MQNLLKPLLFVKTKTGYSIFTVILVTLFSSWALYEAAKTEVVVAADGEEQVVMTHDGTVGELFDNLGIDVGENDALSHEFDAEIVDGMKIDFNSAYQVVVTVDEEIEEYVTTTKTVGEFFEEKNFALTKYDDVSVSNMQGIEEGLEIEITKAFPVTINYGGEKLEVQTTGGTVEELIEEHELEYNEIDKIKPELVEEVTEETKISIVMVEVKSEEKEAAIPFETEKKSDSSMKKGTTKTVTEGKEGTVLKTYEVTYENGKEVDREVIDEDVIKDSTTKVVAKGTKVVQKQAAPKSAKSAKSTTSAKSEPAQSGKVYTMEATAYSPYCNGCSGTSAYGLNLRAQPMPKIVAVDPNVIPLGSRVWVEGYGEAIAGDTGGAIKGNRVDVLLPQGQSVYNWGRRNVQVKVLD